MGRDEGGYGEEEGVVGGFMRAGVSGDWAVGQLRGAGPAKPAHAILYHSRTQCAPRRPKL